MKLAISNIAWEPEEEADVADLLAELEVRHVEIAPTKVFDDPRAVSDTQLHGYVDFWASHGIEIVAFQSMFFGRPDLQLFAEAEVRRETTSVMSSFIALAGRVGARRMVFGSPRNRQVPDGMPSAEADEIAIELFSEWGDLAAAAGTMVCLEPNPIVYDTNFVVDAAAGIDLVSRIDNPGFGLHLDAAGMTLAGDDLGASVRAAGPLLQHFHASAPQLGPVVAGEVDHTGAAAALGEIAYDGFVSIEMRPGPNTADRIRTAVGVVRAAYASA